MIAPGGSSAGEATVRGDAARAVAGDGEFAAAIRESAGQDVAVAGRLVPAHQRDGVVVEVLEKPEVAPTQFVVVGLVAGRKVQPYRSLGQGVECFRRHRIP